MHWACEHELQRCRRRVELPLLAADDASVTATNGDLARPRNQDDVAPPAEMQKRHAWRTRRHELSPVVQRDNADTDEPPHPAMPCKAAATARRRLMAAPGAKGVVRTRVVYAQFGWPARPGGGASRLVGAEESMGAPRGRLSLTSISIVDYFRNRITQF
jgi:hypothetical protein